MKRLPFLLTLCITSLAGPFLLTISELRANGQAVAVKAVVFETDIEPSAVEPIGNGKFLLVADDKQSDLFIVDAETGAIAGHRLSIAKATSTNPKWEAMAKDGKDYYVLGTKCSCLYRFSLKNEAETDPVKIDVEMVSGPIAVKGEIMGAAARVEGLAVWVNDNKEKELVFGIRDTPGKALLRVARAKISDGELSLLEFFAFCAKKPDGQPVEWHISSLEYVQALDGFLVITSTEDDRTNHFYGNKLWFVSRKNLNTSEPSSCTGTFKDATKLMIEGKVFDSTMKAEGLAIIDDARSRVALVFDNDYKKTRQTAKLAVFTLSDLIEIINQPYSHH
ncbi:MAG TPA: hypothetical protein VJM12_11840 [Pyrinomonadaceae bacterium]|nr:hypothetical protein [Pyrinomonadaceae bacterium]